MKIKTQHVTPQINPSETHLNNKIPWINPGKRAFCGSVITALTLWAARARGFYLFVPRAAVEIGARVGGEEGGGGGCWILLWMAPLEMHVWFQKVDKALAHFGSLEPPVVSQIMMDAREVRRLSLLQRFLCWAAHPTFALKHSRFEPDRGRNPPHFSNPRQNDVRKHD